MAEGIRYSQQLLLSLEASLRSAFNQRYLSLTRRPQIHSPAFSVELVDDGKYVEADDGLTHRVLEMLTAQGQSTPFYFGFVAEFEVGAITRTHVLQHASLMVFHDIYAGVLTSLFRAEWDEKAACDTASEHAQPHWHFVQSPARIESIVRSVVSPDNEFIPERESELFVGPDCGRFHFAMASMWDKSKSPSYKHVFEAGDFPKWFASLTKYIAGQIAYLIKHAPVEQRFNSVLSGI